MEKRKLKKSHSNYKYIRLLYDNFGIASNHKISQRVRQMIIEYGEDLKLAPSVDDIIKFVDKIERRKGLATDKDVFVDLLDYFDYVSFYLDNTPVRRICTFDKNDQILVMYAYVLLFVNKIKSGDLLAITLDDYILLVEKDELPVSGK